MAGGAWQPSTTKPEERPLELAARDYWSNEVEVEGTRVSLEKVEWKRGALSVWGLSLVGSDWKKRAGSQGWRMGCSVVGCQRASAGFGVLLCC